MDTHSRVFNKLVLWPIAVLAVLSLALGPLGSMALAKGGPPQRVQVIVQGRNANAVAAAVSAGGGEVKGIERTALIKGGGLGGIHILGQGIVKDPGAEADSPTFAIADGEDELATKAVVGLAVFRLNE